MEHSLAIHRGALLRGDPSLTISSLKTLSAFTAAQFRVGRRTDSTCNEMCTTQNYHQTAARTKPIHLKDNDPLPPSLLQLTYPSAGDVHTDHHHRPPSRPASPLHSWPIRLMDSMISITIRMGSRAPGHWCGDVSVGWGDEYGGRARFLGVSDGFFEILRRDKVAGEKMEIAHVSIYRMRLGVGDLDRDGRRRWEDRNLFSRVEEGGELCGGNRSKSFRCRFSDLQQRKNEDKIVY